jgi:hypothetical protein
MDVFIHRATLQEAMQFRPAFLPWPEGVEQDAAGNFFMHWPRGNNDPIRGGDYVVFRGGRPFAIFPRAEFEEKFQRIGVAEPRQMTPELVKMRDEALEEHRRGETLPFGI